MRPALVVHCNRHVHGPAADPAILHVALLLRGGIDQDFDGLAAVGARDLEGLGLDQRHRSSQKHLTPLPLHSESIRSDETKPTCIEVLIAFRAGRSILVECQSETETLRELTPDT